MKDYEIKLPEAIKENESVFSNEELEMLSNAILNAIKALHQSKDIAGNYYIDTPEISVGIKKYRDLNTKICGMMGGE